MLKMLLIVSATSASLSFASSLLNPQLTRSLPSLQNLDQSEHWERLSHEASQYPSIKSKNLSLDIFIALLLNHPNPFEHEHEKQLKIVEVHPLWVENHRRVKRSNRQQHPETVVVVSKYSDKPRAAVALSRSSLLHSNFFEAKLRFSRHPDDLSHIKAFGVEVDAYTLIATSYLLDYLHTHMQRRDYGEDEVVRRASKHLEIAYANLIEQGKINPRSLFDSCRAFAKTINWQPLNACFDVFSIQYLNETNED